MCTTKKNFDANVDYIKSLENRSKVFYENLCISSELVDAICAKLIAPPYPWLHPHLDNTICAEWNLPDGDLILKVSDKTKKAELSFFAKKTDVHPAHQHFDFDDENLWSLISTFLEKHR